MNLEDEMYRVMAALSAGDVPVDFKGAMVLHAFLYEKGFSETAIRPTRDIRNRYRMCDNLYVAYDF